MERRSLPRDLIEDILSRVQVKSLARLRSTSKQWNALLKSNGFAKIHSANAPKEESLNIMLMDSRVCLVRIKYRGIHDNKVAPSFKVVAQFYLKDPLSSSSQVDIGNIFHCDGLLLCTTKDKRLVVWNPCSGLTKWVKPRDSYKESDYYALGYDNKSSCKQYKILRVDRREYGRHNSYEIYDFTSNSWRVLGVASDWVLKEHRSGISVKGITYWVATQRRRPYADFLLSFDYSKEMFQSLSLPYPFRYRIPVLSVVREEELCLLGTNAYPSNIQVWVLTSTGSWNKSLAVRPIHYQGYLYNFQGYPFNFSERMSFLVDEQNKVVVVCANNILDIVQENKNILEYHHAVNSTGTPSSCSLLLNYVLSLAHIKQPSLRELFMLEDAQGK
ncbi:hypothetical protein EUTSA_v10022281mg [Eutrema salsugineum]|uniref:F-box domain-containing protein n=1 Tax=Eutrema salsugineum TaxID=72664 RepID=V4LYD2_EUTSA|nr:hypothetical protein EUTSA_v10022281mg [Eutrema salsugineum]